MMGGQIQAASAPGRGSQFSVEVPLPRHEGPAPAADAAAGEGASLGAPAADDRPIRVLLAEDHIVNQRVVELILEPAGVELTKVENGAEAVAAFIVGEFALVLMDMQMPVMDGLAATRAIREFEAQVAGGGRTPIIMLSANAMRQHSEEAIAAGADMHLAKPVTPASLLGALTQALSGAEAVVG
jgi:CheY-like chemotaxis protein